jgi:hypothetical protein
MDAYDVCTACDCHIKTEEPRCPFCGVPHTPNARSARRSLVRMSRAQWLAFGSTLAVVGCTEHFPSIPVSQPVADATMPEASALDDSSAPQTGTWDDSAEPEADGAEDAAALEADTSQDTAAPRADAAQDAGPDTALADAADADSCAVPAGMFLCPIHSAISSFPDCPACDRATQYCSEGYYRYPGCFAFADDASPFPFPPRCVAQPTCACLVARGLSWAARPGAPVRTSMTRELSACTAPPATARPLHGLNDSCARISIPERPCRPRTGETARAAAGGRPCGVVPLRIYVPCPMRVNVSPAFGMVSPLVSVHS